MSCTFKGLCTAVGCALAHPVGSETLELRKQNAAAKSKAKAAAKAAADKDAKVVDAHRAQNHQKVTPCRAGATCTFRGCTFGHPEQVVKPVVEEVVKPVAVKSQFSAKAFAFVPVCKTVVSAPKITFCSNNMCGALLNGITECPYCNESEVEFEDDFEEESEEEFEDDGDNYDAELAEFERLSAAIASPAASVVVEQKRPAFVLTLKKK